MDVDIAVEMKENVCDSKVDKPVDKNAEDGKHMAAFDNVQCMTPRGRFDVKIYPTNVRLHGKALDNNIPLSTISNLFQLPDGPKQSNKVLFVLSLSTPITHGKTTHHHIVLSFPKEDDINLELQVDQTELDSQYDGKLKKEMSGAAYELFSKVISTLLQKGVTLPDESFSKSNGGNAAIVCYHKVNDGFLYPLEQAFIFLHRPPIHIPFNKIGSVNISRTGGSNRMFDLEIMTDSLHSFTQINADMEPKLSNFIKRKGIKNANPGSGSCETSKGRKTIIDIDSEDSDPEDESFNPEAVKEKEVGEEFDTDASDNSDSSSDGDSDSDSDDDGSASSDHLSDDSDSDETPSKKAKMDK